MKKKIKMIIRSSKDIWLPRCSPGWRNPKAWWDQQPWLRMRRKWRRIRITMNKKKIRKKKSFEFLLLLFALLNFYHTIIFARQRERWEDFTTAQRNLRRKEWALEKYRRKKKEKSSREFKFSSCLPLFLLPPPLSPPHHLFLYTPTTDDSSVSLLFLPSSFEIEKQGEIFMPQSEDWWGFEWGKSRSSVEGEKH